MKYVLVLLLAGCAHFQERDLRRITIETECEGNSTGIQINKDTGSDSREIQRP